MVQSTHHHNAHVLRARPDGGRNKAAKGELRRGPPVGFVWGEEDGEVRYHPDEAVGTAIRQVFARFAETGSARRVWLWFRSERFKFPLQMHQGGEIRWVEASYTAIHHMLTNPICRRLLLRENPPGDRPGCRWRPQETSAPFAARRMAGADPEPSSGFHRLADL